jgi:hypothetical protein
VPSSTAPATLYCAITSHGFGHASRACSVLAELQRRQPNLRLIIATTAPQWLLAAYLPGEFELRSIAFDIGVIQADSLTMDLPATLAQLALIRQRAEATIAEEVAFLRRENVGLILGDIPPLLTRIAEAAELPCWMMSNFGWDFIYEPWGADFGLDVAEDLAWIRDCFRRCDRLFRLPFHEPMAAFPVIEDVGLTGGDPRYALADLRQTFDLTAPIERTTLLTFGGLGLQQIPYAALDRFPDWQFITFDRQAPDRPNLRRVTDHQYRPVDFMPLCGRILSKPGYGTFAEACRQGTPIVSLTREDFAEAQLLLDGIVSQVPYRIIEPDRFFGGDWSFLDEAFMPPQAGLALAQDGNAGIAGAIVDFFA